MRALIDTNILIDYLAQREPFCDGWEKLCAMQVLGDVELWAAPQSFADAFYVLNGQVESADLQQVFLECLEFINVCSVSGTEIKAACERCWKDYEDSLIAICAEKIQADYLLTRNEDGFRQLKIPCYSLDGFFEMLNKDFRLRYEVVDF